MPQQRTLASAWSVFRRRSFPGVPRKRPPMLRGRMVAGLHIHSFDLDQPGRRTLVPTFHQFPPARRPQMGVEVPIRGAFPKYLFRNIFSAILHRILSRKPESAKA